jgi:hypothetical protein
MGEKLELALVAVVVEREARWVFVASVDEGVNSPAGTLGPRLMVAGDDVAILEMAFFCLCAGTAPAAAPTAAAAPASAPRGATWAVVVPTVFTFFSLSLVIWRVVGVGVAGVRQGHLGHRLFDHLPCITIATGSGSYS